MASIGGFLRATVVGTIFDTPHIGSKRETNGLPTFATTKLHISRWHKDPTGKNILSSAWLTCVFFGRRAATIEIHANKGTRIFASGRLEQKKWIDKEGGKHLDYELVVDDFQFLDRKEFSRTAEVEADVSCEAEHRKRNFKRNYKGAFR